MKIPIEALELYTMVSTDEHRESICWLQIKKVGPNTVRATATNGHILGQHTWKTDDTPTEPIYLHPQDIKNVLKGTSKKDRALGAEYENGRLSIGGVVVTLRAPGYHVSYPDAEQVVPARGKAIKLTEAIGLDLSYVHLFATYAKRCWINPQMRFQITDPLEPVRVDMTDDTDTVFVIMPVRV